MDLRLMEVLVPAERRAAVERVLGSHEVLSSWFDSTGEGGIIARVLLPASRTEPVLDDLQRAIVESELRVVVLPAAAALPRPPEDAEAGRDEDGEEAEPEPQRIAREELYTAVAGSVRLSRVNATLVVLSGVVAAVGMLKDDVAVVIGAMVIAPMLGPNVALALATTLADRALARRALVANAAGAALVLLLAVGLGLALPVDPELGQIASRTRLDFGHLALALAAGSAGALAFTTGISAMLIGVMVAVALLPPTVAFGLLLGAGHPDAAWGAGLLALGNIICVNLAGVVTFLAQGIRPRTWWEAERAKSATRFALVVWSILLLGLVFVIGFSRAV